MADLSKSFLIRKQADGIFKKMPVDFEALFLRGDLAENQVMAPDDYLYFPPLNLQEVYVLGEVARPGVAPYLESQTALRAIVARGGFTDKAYRSKVLVVRGSLNHPQTFVLDVSDLLAGKSLDFPLAAGDIVYIHRKPWYKVDELLQLAVTDFLRAAVITYGGTRVGPFITKPVF
jgi:protein involved in polysaccharide export with SLBB domain